MRGAPDARATRRLPRLRRQSVGARLPGVRCYQRRRPRRTVWGTYPIVMVGSAIGLGLKPFHAA
jgi:hypothetical protein